MSALEDTRLLTLEEVAHMCAVHPATVRREVQAGRLRAVRLGGTKRRLLRFRPEDVAEWLESSR
jgi:excisionase family DNA binding protein